MNTKELSRCITIFWKPVYPVCLNLPLHVALFTDILATIIFPSRRTQVMVAIARGITCSFRQKAYSVN